MNQVQITVNENARIKINGNNYQNKKAFITFATQTSGNKFYYHQNGRMVQVYGNIDIIGE